MQVKTTIRYYYEPTRKADTGKIHKPCGRGIVYNNEIIISSYISNMSDFHNHDGEWKKPDTKQSIIYDSVYGELRNRQKSSMMSVSQHHSDLCEGGR